MRRTSRRRAAAACAVSFVLGAMALGSAPAGQAIIGGRAATARQFPYLVQLTAPAVGGLCTATLIHPSWVLTAQHCATVNGPTDLQVRIGNTLDGTGGEVIPIKGIRLDPAYDAQVDDVALLHLQWPAIHRPVRLADPSLIGLWDGLGADEAVAVGWGRTAPSGPAASTLQSVSVRISPDGADPRGNRKITLDGAVNAGPPARGTCPGDSGGPLLVTAPDGSLRLAGVVKAADCAGAGFYSEVGAGPTRTRIRRQIPDLDNPLQTEFANTVYGVQANGDITCFVHRGYSDGAPRWSDPVTAGTGAGGFTTVFTGSGAIYGVSADGKVRYYRHDGYASCGATTADWTFPGGKVVISGWTGLVTAFGMPGSSPGTGGVIYTLDTAGNLRWWRHNGWATGAGPESATAWSGGTVVGVGWNAFTKVFPGQDGEIYAITPTGDLREFVHLGWQDGAVRWGAVATVGHGWSGYSKVFSGGGDGVVYGVNAAAELIWFKHVGHRRQAVAWQGPFTVGVGWQSITKAFVHSPPPGVLH